MVEFYKRTGQGMTAEFINSDIKSVPKGQSSTNGASRTFSIPPGTSAIYLTETGNAVNTDRESNENSRKPMRTSISPTKPPPATSTSRLV
ncbi:hypothetical protein MKQ70_11230 [Chitinophaga sedimenti]|uniref:hypothetical protein n=1 Tax=Chitinophaga sedimenti TaxID=2033606 RepID=UPI002004F5F1|nr:hypothetical protein [Chitinophaga sedimenti]MCK7555549.1 hypothetical protein [Chitinophaga sedimenti]